MTCFLLAVRHRTRRAKRYAATTRFGDARCSCGAAPASCRSLVGRTEDSRAAVQSFLCPRRGSPLLATFYVVTLLRSPLRRSARSEPSCPTVGAWTARAWARAGRVVWRFSPSRRPAALSSCRFYVVPFCAPRGGTSPLLLRHTPVRAASDATRARGAPRAASGVTYGAWCMALGLRPRRGITARLLSRGGPVPRAEQRPSSGRDGAKERRARHGGDGWALRATRLSRPSQ